MAAGHTRNSDSWREPPRGIRRSSACPRGPDPSPEGHMPQPDSARKGGLDGTPVCGLALRGLVGAIGWSSTSSRYAGGAAATGRLVRPFHLTTFYPLGGLGYRMPLALTGEQAPGTPCQ
ncbi:uncharacterized protein N7529_002117 [Penicillium soppii]|uniref:uncharacterized protein n=1 Tax=Penicillium soppii TaxID=69789 RepID=UPI002549312C|nr:uncharacterized protein N7529_002117 [Penicillium soppii]KAJ5876533.1 hypothetical protein N7529_002117 [Penicillium soppii]